MPSNHLPFVDQPSEFVRAIEEFIHQEYQLRILSSLR